MQYAGSCLCGKIRFAVKTDIHTLYHCHCSLCRKQSGTASNAATLVNTQYFAWIAGESWISHYQKQTGFRSDFCQSCGSPVPNQVGSSSLMWIPLGLLDASAQIQYKMSFCLNSKTAWAENIQVDERHAELPDFATLKAYFYR
ncbi:MAG: GFA family protein [Acinetobacter sp.]